MPGSERSIQRRRYLITVAATISGVSMAGCMGSGNDGDDENGEDIDTGVIIDDELTELWEDFVDVNSGQTITVEASNVGDGEELQFQVGDGTQFVHTEHIYEDGNDSYTFETDGQHQIQFHPKRHEAPMDEDVTVAVQAQIE